MKELSEKKVSLPDLLLYAGMGKDAYLKAENEILETNRKELMQLSAIAGGFLLIMTLVSFLNRGLADMRFLYICFLVVSAVIFLLAWKYSEGNNTVIESLVLLFVAELYMFGIMLGTYGTPSELTTAYIALLLTAPQMFVIRPYKMHVLTILSVAVFIALSRLLKDPVTWNSDTVNVIVFGCISMLCSTYVNYIKGQRYFLIDRVRTLAENDQLTGLKNRNSYELRLKKEAVLGTDSMFCVYVDVNGLHEINNTQGHDAGDRMLQYVATAMRNIFGEGDTYRVGGDEYVALVHDWPVEKAEAAVKDLKQAVEAAGYHVAVGLEYGKKAKFDVSHLLKAAEEHMYQDKREYYARTGKRQARVDA